MKPILRFNLIVFFLCNCSLAIAQNKSTKENHTPVFVKEMPDTTIGNQNTFRFTIQATDADGDKIKYGSVSTLPAGATINDSTGIFSWKPTSGQVGKHQIILTASDGQLTIQSRTTTITVILYGNYDSQIVVSRKPEEGGKANGALCNVGDTVTIKAFTNPGYRFMSWAENNIFASKDSFYTFIVTGNRNLVANFRVNHAPVFVKEMPDTAIMATTKYFFKYEAVDPDGDSLKFYTSTQLPNSSVLLENGQFGWRPSNNDFIYANKTEVIIYVTDGILKTFSRKTTLRIREVSSINDNNEVPKEYSLSQNYPNPFNPETTIEYSVPVETRRGESLQRISLRVYDVLGREVATLVDEYKRSGNYKVTFNTRHLERSREMTSGVYFYQLRSGNYVETKKLVLMK